MKLRRLRIENYRGVARAELELPPLGVTLVTGPNEAGKSSLVEALDLLLDKKDSCKDASVRATWPVHSDGPTLVEAELELGAHLLRYRKSFRRSTATELEVRGPRPESWTGDEAHARARELLEAHLDTTLWRALRIEQGRASLGLDLSGQRALSHALEQAACAAEAGSESTLYGRVRDELARYYTEKRLDPRKILREACADQAQAEAEVERLEAQIAELEQHVERVRELEAGAAELARGESELEGEVRDARAGAARAEELARALERIDAKLALAGERSGAARRELEARLARAAGHARDDAVLAALSERGESERDALEARREQAQDAQRALAQAHEELREAIAQRDALRDRLELARVEARLAAIASARQRADAATEARRRAGVGDAQLAALERAAADSARASERCAALDARLEIEALGDVTLEIDGTARALERGARLERGACELDLRVPGTLRLRIAPGTSLREAREELVQSEARLASLLRETGTESLADARARNAGHRAAELDGARAEARLGELLAEASADALAQRQGALRQRIAERASDEPAEEASEDALGSARAAARSAEALARAAEHAQQRAQRELEASERGHAARAAELRARAAAAALESAALEQARLGASDAALAERSAACARDAESLAQERSRLASELAQRPLDGARARLARSEGALAELRERRARSEREQLELRGLLRARGEDGLAEQLGAARMRLHHRREERAVLERKARSSRLLFEVVDAERERSRRGYATLLRERVEELGQRVFGPELRVELDSELVLRSRTLAGRTIPFESLSVGAREQIALIARLACALAIAPDGGVPLILDDALGHSDPRRAAALAQLLGWAGERCQILLLTSTPDRYATLRTAARLCI